MSYREWTILQELQVTRSQQWRYFLDKVTFSYETLFLGNLTPLDRALHPSAYNYWLDVLYSFGLLPLIPVVILFFYTIREAWKQQNKLLSNPLLVCTGVIVFNLFLLKVFSEQDLDSRTQGPSLIFSGVSDRTIETEF